MKTLRKVLKWSMLAILGLILASLAFLYFAPGYDMRIVRSGSMVPVINVGDLVISGPVNGLINGEIKARTIVTYQHGKDLITHRVQSIEGNGLVTKGDALEEADPWLVTLDTVQSVYLFKIPYWGYVVNFIQTKTGWFLAIVIPAALLVLWLVKDILKEAFSNAHIEDNKEEVVKGIKIQKSGSTKLK